VGATVILYREILSRSSVKSRGLGRLFRSLRVSFAELSCRVGPLDQPVRLRALRPHSIALEAGSHEIRVTGRGFLPDTKTIDVGEGGSVIVAVTPERPSGADPDWPNGKLHLRVVDDPTDLEPNRFYNSLPSMSATTTLALVGSLAASGAFLLLSLAMVGAVCFGFIARSPGVGVILLLFSCMVIPIALPAGIVGVTAGVRYMRLPRNWRRRPTIITDHG
jgi:hypothetical protein